MYLAVINVEPLNDYKLLLTFDNGEKRIFDVSPYLDKGIFKELKDGRNLRLYVLVLIALNGAIKRILTQSFYLKRVKLAKKISRNIP